MIQAPPADWQASLRTAYRDPHALLADLGIDAEQAACLVPASGEFPLRVPRGFAARMRAGDPDDPLLRQVLPRLEERAEAPGFSADPLAEADFQSQPGLIHKYHGRALLITTGACGVHCRYCFRREFPYAEQAAGGPRWQAALAALRADPSIREVILSGGDPLSLSDARLEELFGELQSIAHLERLRIHTRQPIVLPERITPALCALLASLRLPVVTVVHCNHAQEIDGAVTLALQALREVSAALLNQSVLLAGVNDNAGVLARLSEALFAAGTLPYYLHMLDPVRGSTHFRVAEDRARGIMQDLNARLPGYLVPRLVRELPGASGKLPVAWAQPLEEHA